MPDSRRGMAPPDHTIEFAQRAVRDLRRMPRPDVRRIKSAVDELAAGAKNLDVKPLAGHPPWRRLRVGDFRVLYREIEVTERRGDTPAGWLVARVIDRRDLEQAVRTLR